MANNLYIYDKTTYVQSNYGEVQSQYNMSLVIDGTKDSCKIVVHNNERKEIDPITICYLTDTQTWWIVNSDKVIRYANENGAYYEHTISLLGAIEILNHRDMINCGFNANRYTYTQFFTRLERMFDFEFPITWDLSSYVDMGQKVSYLKTFQNYTPSSAIKEMFNGMNLVAKLRFTTTTTGTTTTITGATIYAISKSGVNQTVINGEQTFYNEEEQSSSNAESFGSRVVSNIENCVSGEIIKFPNAGGTRLVSDEPTVGALNGYLRLPSNIYEVKKLRMYSKICLYVGGLILKNLYLCDYSKEDLLNEVLEVLEDAGSPSYNEVLSNWDTIYSSLVSNGIIDFENGGDWDQINDTYNSKTLLMQADAGAPTNRLWLNDKQHGTTSVFKKWNCIYWEQSKDKIENFEWLNGSNRMRRKADQDQIQYINIFLGDYFEFFYDEDAKYVVNYIPMGDLKVKVDNNIDQNDSNLYNQNGKFVDAGAVSKLINSYSKEISSNEITRSAIFYNFSDIPQVGSLVSLYNDIYIINNISYDFYENEYEQNGGATISGDKYIVCSFTMTKAVACKSTMISANTNIRDYQCPQQNNVPRIQTYRDYFELGYINLPSHVEAPYHSKTQDIFCFGDKYKGLYKNYSVFFSSQFKLYNVDKIYYYTISTTKYNLNKQTIIVADFKDNNVIGCEPGSTYYTLQLSKWIDNLVNHSNVNTPINYANENGEISIINLKFVDEDNILTAYGENREYIGRTFTIPTEIWNNFLGTNLSVINLLETNYNKDGLEVPVFEYCCEVGDDNGIVIGQNFLKGEKVENYDTSGNFIFYYTITRFPSNEIITQENMSKYRNAIGGAYGVVNDPIDITYDNTTRLLKVYVDGEDINRGDNFVINMICCYNNLEISHGWLMEYSLFGINKFNTTTDTSYFNKTFQVVKSITASSTDTVQINLGHRNKNSSITNIDIVCYNQNIEIISRTYQQINKCYYANVTVRNNSNSDQTYTLVITYRRSGHMFALKVNNWKLK